ncbi:MAG: hypothetical protein ABIM22_07725 [candidate division WOR-3 bacterium]
MDKDRKKLAYSGIIWLDNVESEAEEEKEEKKEQKEEKEQKTSKASDMVSYASLVQDEINEADILAEASLIDKIATTLLEKAKKASIIDDTVDMDKFIENVYLAAFAIVNGAGLEPKSAAKGKYKFEKEPDKWKKFWNTLTGDREHKITACIKKLKKSRKDKIDNPEAFCNALAKFVGYK